MKHGAAFESDLQAVTDLHPRAKKEAQTFFETRVPCPPPRVTAHPEPGRKFHRQRQGEGLDASAVKENHGTASTRSGGCSGPSSKAR